MLKLYFAPLEGITGYHFRNAYNKYYKGIDSFYAPFISPYGTSIITPKERRDVEPANNEGLKLVPQILANNSEYFMNTARELYRMGYREININTGCPSGTVCSKKKGAGILRDRELLDSFLKGIFERLDIPVRISVKTRIGYECEEEFPYILDILNRYPISSVIIHPRLRSDMYKGRPKMDSFIYAYNNSNCPLIYNGDVNKASDFKGLMDLLTESVYKSNTSEIKITGVMIGRGLLKNPMLAEQISGVIEGGVDSYNNTGFNVDRDLTRFIAFHNELYDCYRSFISPDKHVLFRMKELWTYFIDGFPDRKKEYKALMKSQRFWEYEAAVRQIVK